VGRLKLSSARANSPPGLSVCVSATMMLIITPKLSDLGPRSSCPIGSIAESAYVASIGDDINDVT